MINAIGNTNSAEDGLVVSSYGSENNLSDETLPSIADRVVNHQPPAGADPGVTELSYADGQLVINSNTNKPLLAPKEVSLSNNIDVGKSLHNMQSIFSDSTSNDVFFPDKEASMVLLFWPGQPMDYQRIYSDTNFINRTYIDYGNYNYGIVSAAAEYSLDEALLGAGMTNAFSTIVNSPKEMLNMFSQSQDKWDTLKTQLRAALKRVSGSYLNNPRVEKLIRQGFDDYSSGRFSD